MVVSGFSCVFFGIDFVLYVCYCKEVSCGCVGCFNVLIVFGSYVMVFEEMNVL